MFIALLLRCWISYAHLCPLHDYTPLSSACVRSNPTAIVLNALGCLGNAARSADGAGEMVAAGACSLLQPLLHHDDILVALKASFALCHVSMHPDTAHTLGQRTLDDMADLVRAVNPLAVACNANVDDNDVRALVELLNPDRYVD